LAAPSKVTLSQTIPIKN